MIIKMIQTLKYKIIRSESQYGKYCKALEQLLDKKPKSKSVEEEIDLLTLLIEKWDEEHNSFSDKDPVKLLESLTESHELNTKKIAVILDINKGLMSDILNYKKGFSKDIIRRLASYFKVSQEAFNRPYNWKKAELLYA